MLNDEMNEIKVKTVKTNQKRNKLHLNITEEPMIDETTTSMKIIKLAHTLFCR